MKILFICGSLENGKDGVGDYTRKLAIELIIQGHTVSIISLMDKYVFNVIKETQYKYIYNIKVLRMPFNSGYKNNCINAKPYIDEYDPDWISLQYVPFSFNNRGLPFNISYHISQITKGRKFQIMFHEIWMGISVISPIKHKIIGYFQKKIAKKLITRCQPKIILTTNKLYQSILTKENIDANVLTLFSNIDKAKFDISFYQKTLSSFSISENERLNWKFIGIFGSLHHQINLEKELYLQIIEANQAEKKLLFISIGRIGQTGEIEFERLKNLFKGKIIFYQFGQVEERVASSLIQMLDLVISCTPAHHIGKSGVFAFFKLHSVPVITIQNEIIPEYTNDLKLWYHNFKLRDDYKWSSKYIANEFILLLN
jgi:hypothetical protein